MQNHSIDLESLRKPLNSSGSYAEAVIARLNEVFGGCWNFRIIEHHIQDTEVIVLGELSVNGALRQQFGRTPILFDQENGNSGSMGEHLKKAAADALIQCAHELGIPHPEKNTNFIDKSNRNNSKSEDNGNGSRKLTNRQLAAIFGIGKSIGLGQKEVISLTKERYSKEPMELTITEASDLISELKQEQGKETQSC